MEYGIGINLKAAVLKPNSCGELSCMVLDCFGLHIGDDVLDPFQSWVSADLLTDLHVEPIEQTDIERTLLID